jgi:hypothetical protein
MERLFVFADESGDPGFGAGCSSRFVMCGLVFGDMSETEKASGIIDSVHAVTGHKSEFKFGNVNPRKRRIFFDGIKACDFRIVAIVCDKSKFAAAEKDFYKFMLRALMKEILSQFGKDRELFVYLDGVKSSRKPLASYLRQSGISLRFHVYDSKKYNLIQMADMFSGAIMCKYRTGGIYLDKFGEKLRIMEMP